MFLLPHLGTIIWLIIIFSLVWIILSKFAWKPLLRALEERENSIETSLRSADEARKSLRKIEEEQHKLIEEASNEKERMIKEAFMQRDKIIADSKQKAQADYDLMVENARKRIEQEKRAANEGIKNQIAMLSVDIATLLIKGDMKDKSRQELVVKELINEVNIN